MPRKMKLEALKKMVTRENEQMFLLGFDKNDRF